MKIYANPQRQWLSAAETELEELVRERDAMNTRIDKLRLTIKALRPFADSEETENRSLPDLCQQVLGYKAGEWLSVPEIKTALESIGVKVPGKNPHAVLHTSLARLAEKGHVAVTGTSPHKFQAYKRSR